MRRAKPEKREILPDIRYNSVHVQTMVQHVLKRGKNSSMELWAWHEAVLQGNIVAARKSCSLIMYNTDGKPVARIGNRRLQQVFHGQLAELAVQFEPAIHRTRHRHRQGPARRNRAAIELAQFFAQFGQRQ